MRRALLCGWVVWMSIAGTNCKREAPAARPAGSDVGLEATATAPKSAPAAAAPETATDAAGAQNGEPPAEPAALSEDNFRALARAIDTRVAAAQKAYDHAWWEAALSGRKEDFDRAAANELVLRAIYSNRNEFALLKAYRESDVLRDPLLRRTAEVLYLSFLENQVPDALRTALVRDAAELEQAFNTFRAEVDGRAVGANDVQKTLSDSNDSEERRRSWEASKAVGPLVAERLQALVRKRNEAARSLGFANFYLLRLQLREQKPEDVQALFEAIDRGTAEPYRAAKAELDQRLAARFGIASDALRPWHYGDVFFQDSPGVEGLDLDAAFAKAEPQTLAVRFYESIGLPVVKDILARSDLFERPGKVEHAFCTHLDREGDVRVLANLKSNERWTATLLHELGHGVYDAHIERGLPFVLRLPAHEFVTEGVAELFGTLTRDAEWLAEFTRLPAATRSRLAALAQQEARLEGLIFARWSLVMVNFERALYENPDQDLNRLWWQLVQRYQGVQPPADLAGRADWAAKIHVVTVPAYYHNYMMGRLFAAQLRERIAESIPAAVVDGRLRLAGRPEVGAFLTQTVFAPGLRMGPDAFVKQVTGKPLGPEAWLATL